MKYKIWPNLASWGLVELESIGMGVGVDKIKRPAESGTWQQSKGRQTNQRLYQRIQS